MLNRGGYGPDGYSSYIPLVVIYNTHRGVLEEAQKLMGGTITNGRRRSPRHKVSYSLVLMGQRRMLDVLKRLEPELIIKRKHSVVLMAYCARRQRGHCRIDRADFELISQLRALNGGKLRETFKERVASLKPSGFPRGPKKHGESATYVSGCRCRPCKSAHTIYMRAWRRGRDIRSVITLRR